MPSKFGGIPVDDEQPRSKFGGIPVNDLVLPDGSSATAAGERLQQINQWEMENDPTNGMSGPERVAAGVGRSVYETGRGIQQRFGGRTQEQVDDDRRIDGPLMRTPGGQVGNVGGVAGQILGPGGVLKLAARVPQAAAAAPMLNGASQAFLPNIAGTGVRSGLANVGANSAQSAVFGAIQPTATGEDWRANAGGAALFGGAGALVPRVAGWGVRGVRDGVRNVTGEGAERNAVRLIQEEASDPNALLRSNPSQVPNARRTLFEESLDPGVARLETRARGAGGGWADADSVNNAARSDAITAFAGDDAAITAAARARSAAADPLRNSAMADRGVDIAPVTTRLDQLIAGSATRPSKQAALLDLQGSLNAADDTVESLYGTRKYIDDLMTGKAGADKGYAKAAKAELVQIKALLDQQIGKASPDFRTYLDTFIAGSKPIDRMKLGQTLLDSGSGRLRDPSTGKYVLMPGQFGGQVKNLDKAASRATGFKGANGEGILGPVNMATVRAVDDDLSRSASRLTRGAGGGSHTASQQEVGKRIAARSLVRILPGVNVAMEFLEQAGAKRLQGALDTVLRDPQKYRAVAAQLSREDQRLLQAAVNRTGGTSGAIMLPASE